MEQIEVKEFAFMAQEELAGLTVQDFNPAPNYDCAEYPRNLWIRDINALAAELIEDFGHDSITRLLLSLMRRGEFSRHFWEKISRLERYKNYVDSTRLPEVSTGKIRMIHRPNTDLVTALLLAYWEPVARAQGKTLHDVWLRWEGQEIRNRLW